MKLLSVVVPCYNSATYMKKCIDSLLTGGDRVEIVVVDDGSTDETAFIADDYVGRFPDIVKVVHQKNGGHGAGINSGLKAATGKFFKVVDSDDAVGDCFKEFLDKLECDAAGADLVVTNYVYTYSDGRKNNPIKYGSVFKKDTLLDWSQTKKFKLKQCLTIHSCTFRTETVRKSGMVLPEHIFYEDNLMICTVLPYTEKVFYHDCDLYHYSIGRSGQSVQADVMISRYDHQVRIAADIFETCRLDEVRKKCKRLYDVMYHEMFMMYGIACVFARLSPEKDAYDKLCDMWERAYRFDEKYAEKFRKRTPLALVSAKGRFGKFVTKIVYKIAYSVVKFN